MLSSQYFYNKYKLVIVGKSYLVQMRSNINICCENIKDLAIF